MFHFRADLLPALTMPELADKPTHRGGRSGCCGLSADAMVDAIVDKATHDCRNGSNMADFHGGIGGEWHTRPPVPHERGLARKRASKPEKSELGTFEESRGSSPQAE